MSTARSLRVRTMGLEQAQKQPLAWKCRQERRGKWTPADRLNEHVFQQCQASHGHVWRLAVMLAFWLVTRIRHVPLNTLLYLLYYTGTHALLYRPGRFDSGKRNSSIPPEQRSDTITPLFDCSVSFHLTSSCPVISIINWLKLCPDNCPISSMDEFFHWMLIGEGFRTGKKRSALIFNNTSLRLSQNADLSIWLNAFALANTLCNPL